MEYRKIGGSGLELSAITFGAWAAGGWMWGRTDRLDAMEAIRASGKVLGADRIAVMAALQISQELMAAKNSDGISIVELRRRLRDLNALTDDMLAPQEKLFP